MNNQRNCF